MNQDDFLALETLQQETAELAAMRQRELSVLQLELQKASIFTAIYSNFTSILPPFAACLPRFTSMPVTF